MECVRCHAFPVVNSKKNGFTLILLLLLLFLLKKKKTFRYDDNKTSKIVKIKYKKRNKNSKATNNRTEQ